MSGINNGKILEFVRYVNILKHKRREGWFLSGLRNTESISGHMYAMGMLTFLLGNDSNLDRLKCLQMALIHDLAESIIGDITPHDGVPPEVKKIKEENAMKEITSNLDKEIGTAMLDLFKEYEDRETPEAKFVKDLDIFDLLFTAVEYEERDNIPGKLQEYFQETVNKINHPLIKSLVEDLLKKRQVLMEKSTLKNE